MTAKLALENGVVLSGTAFGAPVEATGEIVFNTSLTGYQEILTDPSYAGQIVVFTYPQIGNYGVNPDDMEGKKPHVAGLVVREYLDFYSNHRATESLGEWLQRFGVPAIQGVDTRMLTKMIRDGGAMRAAISSNSSVSSGGGEIDDKSLLAKVLASPQMAGLDLTKQVTTEKPYQWTGDAATPFDLKPEFAPGHDSNRKFHVVVYDYGVKRNILRRLSAYGCRLTVVPSDFPADEVLKMNPDGIFLSNGPGDPAAVGYAIESIKKLLGKKPIFGICLGHQLLAHALGGKTYKLKFGHRGGNHPVKNLRTNAIEITSQNHGFAVDPDSLNASDVEITHVNLNDGTNEGFRHRSLPLFCVQYHPESAPGPHDSDYLYREFIELMGA